MSRAARAVASARVCPVASSSAEFAAVVDAHASILHGARNSGAAGGLLPVQRSTSYCLDNSWSDTGSAQGPRGRKTVKRWRCTADGVRSASGAQRVCLGGSDPRLCM